VIKIVDVYALSITASRHKAALQCAAFSVLWIATTGQKLSITTKINEYGPPKIIVILHG
jgi:hypothetical protein